MFPIFQWPFLGSNFKKYHHFQTKPYPICLLLRSIEVQLFKGHHIIFGEIVVPGATYLEPLGTGELLKTLDDSRAITSGLNIMIHHETSVSQKSFHVWFLKRGFVRILPPKPGCPAVFGILGIANHSLTCPAMVSWGCFPSRCRVPSPRVGSR